MCKIQDSGYTYRGKVFKETKFQSKNRWLCHQEIIHVSQDAQHVKVSKILQRKEKKSLNWERLLKEQRYLKRYGDVAESVLVKRNPQSLCTNITQNILRTKNFQYFGEI